MSDLNGKVALVSGAPRGIGDAIAQTMVDHGAKIVIGDALDVEGQELAEKIGPPEGAITDQQVFGRQALAASVPGGEVVD